MKPKPLISVIVPFYNEEEGLAACLDSIRAQTYKNFELLMVDDGSTDGSAAIAEGFVKRLRGQGQLLRGQHHGPGAARNMAAELALGKILVLVDADMQAKRDFLDRITLPIRAKGEDGTFVIDELVSNPENPWSKAWSLAHRLPPGRRIPEDAPLRANTYRAILRSKFLAAGGHREERGVSEDEMDTTQLKPGLGVRGAVLYHKNPGSFGEVWLSARWYGRGKASYLPLGAWVYLLLVHHPLRSLLAASWGAMKHRSPFYFGFKLIFDAAVSYGLFEGRLTGRKAR